MIQPWAGGIMLGRLVVLSLLSADAAAAPYVATSFFPTCPGPMLLQVSGIAPGERYAILTGDALGAALLPAGPCVFAQSGMVGLTLRAIRTADPTGNDFVSVPNLPGALCGDMVQVFDLDTCASSPAIPISPTCTSMGGYRFCEEVVSWEAARDVCAGEGETLVSIADATEQANLFALWTQWAWIGFNDLAQEGNWVWDSGAPVTYTNWMNQFEPNGGSNENCAAMNPASGGWADGPCANGWVPTSFVCEP